ncbi:Polyketide synthase, enoylreductase domain [Fusarium oxysporum f. sp. vasinfectum]|uniref:Enoyl reductase (ER) domain-containing protein n=1 Tax=Fusarium oxysporum f. sp. vasinfectum 25433 TaxID=1089449 RepID=X0KSP0_FUSOX|nr:hypothetical protein FOTG_15070 [Fusarium oxysporum f. sp. vasinfectum 25433]KAK2668948.1 Polyketide synthase, enoylreductase domain [Fusarium oxysporum f. sp. vasinfectum]KAK2925407.1 Polyketide synthase, enoylreductase domain [Fusarium oxysporum f. sp. vasinfectum]
MADTTIPPDAEALVYDKATRSLVVKTLPVPKATGPEDHLLRVHAVALTNGELAWPEPLEFPDPVPGYELAATVITAPPKSPFTPGTEVYARTNFERLGSARPFSIATTAELGHKPANLSWEEAATVPLSALTAWQALFVHGGLVAPDFQDLDEVRAKNAGRRVLITAAAGGVGLWLVQLARLAGAYVIGTCGSANVDFVIELGAHEVLDYGTTNLATWAGEDPTARKFDLGLDCVGQTTLEQVWSVTRSGGKVISIVDEPGKAKPTTVDADVNSLFFIVEANSEQLDRISKLIEAGTCKAFVDSVFDLRDGAKAMEKLNGRRLRGKVVLRITA